MNGAAEIDIQPNCRAVINIADCELDRINNTPFTRSESRKFSQYYSASCFIPDKLSYEARIVVGSSGPSAHLDVLAKRQTRDLRILCSDVVRIAEGRGCDVAPSGGDLWRIGKAGCEQAGHADRVGDVLCGHPCVGLSL